MVSPTLPNRIEEKPNNSPFKCPFPLEIEPENLSPQEFCRRMLGIAGMPENYLRLYENQRNYRKECILLLSRILDVNPNTIKNWGLNFAKMPYTYRRILGVYYERLKLIREKQESGVRSQESGVRSYPKTTEIQSNGRKPPLSTDN